MLSWQLLCSHDLHATQAQQRCSMHLKCCSSGLISLFDVAAWPRRLLPSHSLLSEACMLVMLGGEACFNDVDGCWVYKRSGLFKSLESSNSFGMLECSDGRCSMVPQS